MCTVTSVDNVQTENVWRIDVHVVCNISLYVYVAFPLSSHGKFNTSAARKL